MKIRQKYWNILIFRLKKTNEKNLFINCLKISLKKSVITVVLPYKSEIRACKDRLVSRYKTIIKQIIQILVQLL